ncbi:MAG: N-6 DNA methylase, partial [Thermoguttaceae bacterium]|nr:N-6 DNA methylase [Thermoguttaceae bacterium]
MSETGTPFEVAERNTRGGPASGRRAARALSAQKSAGRVYTPESIVNDILNLSGYVGKRILKRHVIDNSCGDGAFLGPIVERYCRECEPRRLKRELEEFVHGIEIDAGELGKCVKRLDAVAARYGASGVRWDVQCGDALKARQYDGKMDFVLGNPPYIRVHNLGESFDSVKRFAFARGGMTDLYLVF